ncbi:alpha-amylase family glycosyl hydrolase [Bifidobacterium sp. ESL0764]|uniref:alpha-amylase family glycosyl hydrolase n=1 Tax=Bifidobacterium sp. ESL0764 TaxID=2983228 RepID=UPI0023F90CE4|nr:alpha-amylase family glycosyl hydrolase [Bifidobacterium sp. ESL0764]WEV65710.1 alpha-amylase family glycosyl hydrolase [Bifidobacterium sp. ESL0764]
MGVFPSPEWLKSAVFYEIYPQSFRDSNADGIGDLNGIIEKLDYIKGLGCNALWINPCFESPFKDAGYDVSDYCKIAPRYGTNDDMIRLFRQAHAKGMRVLLDLVPGHTSEEHEWFRQSTKVERNEYSDRFIWTDGAFSGYALPFIGGESKRDAAYILNFFKCQPALNYGFAKIDRPWQMSTDSPAARATKQAMVDVMRYWLSRGCDGFRVDMARSLVKNDDAHHHATIEAWKEMLSPVKQEFPESAFVSEWAAPQDALSAGFDMDFYLNHEKTAVREANGYNLLARRFVKDGEQEKDLSYFTADSGTSIKAFLADYLPEYEATKDRGYFCFLTCNHDTVRLAPRLSDLEIKIAYGMLLTMPGVPFVYYGDEIAMRYYALPTKEGGYFRTGSRTPMQWGAGANLGFSQGAKEDLYLPVDPSQDAPTVEKQEKDPDSMLHWTKLLLGLRPGHRALRADGGFEVVAAPENGRSFAYLRSGDDGERLLIALNPGLEDERVALPDGLNPAESEDCLAAIGQVRPESGEEGNALSLGAQSFAVLRC